MEITQIVKTEHNFDSMIKIKNLIKKAKELGYQSIAVVDDNTMYSIADFMIACKANGIKGIVGMEIKINMDNRIYNLKLFVKNKIGYKNISKISTLLSKKDKREKEIKLSELSLLSSGLICLVDVENVIKNKENDIKRINADINNIKNIFENDFYFEFKSEYDLAYKNNLIKYASNLSVELIATDVSYYLEERELEPANYLYSIKHNKTVSEIDLSNKKLKTIEEMTKLFSGFENQLKNTKYLNEKCDYSLSIKGMTGFKQKNPKFEIPSDFKMMNNIENFFTKMDGYELTTDQEELKTIHYLIYNSWKGFAKLYKKTDTVAIDRLKYELGVIIGKGYSDYFLVISDIIKYSKSKNIGVSVRGSVLSSILARCLGITNICPIKYGLKFERFLNPKRSDSPDIDIDVSQKNRYEIIRYIQNKYNKQKVSLIITFNNYGLKNALGTIGKILKVPTDVQNKLFNMLPKNKNLLKDKREVLEWAKKDSKIKKLIELSYMIAEYPKSISKSAAGVVIGDEFLINDMPMEYRKDSEGQFLITQYHNNNSQLERLGYLKVDILGLRNLDIIDETKKLIKENHGIEIGEIPLEDKKTIDLYKSGDLIGLFQVESEGMRESSKLISPNSIDDIIALVALFRPGPKNEIERYAYNKNNRLKDVYDVDGKIIDNELIRNILSETYGVLTYQEQIYTLAQEVANYSISEADLLRRAISKKKKEILDNERNNFVKKATENSFSEKDADRLYDLILRFSDYGLNKAHSAAYAIFSYITGWFKSNYPIEYMTVLINSVIQNKTKKINKAAEYYLEAKKIGIEMGKPNINESFSEFTIVNNKIEFGLAMIKNVGNSYAEEIVKERGANGKFTSFGNFILRMGATAPVESLIKVGAFDQFGSRKMLLDMLAGNKKSINDDQYSFSDIPGLGKDDISLKEEEFELDQILKFEKELTCMYLTETSIDKLKDVISEAEKNKVNKTSSKSWFGVIVTDIQSFKTKKDKKEMAYLQVLSSSGEFKITVFNKQWEEYKDFIKLYEPLLVNIYPKNEDKILNDLDKIKIINEVNIKIPEKVKNKNNLIKNITEVILKYPGEDNVVIEVGDKKLIKKNIFSCEENSMKEIESLINEEIKVTIKKSSV